VIGRIAERVSPRRRHDDVEAIFWRVIATYLKAHSNEATSRGWQEIRDRFPDSIWAKRVPRDNQSGG
jgi:hypothetical protein